MLLHPDNADAVSHSAAIKLSAFSEELSSRRFRWMKGAPEAKTRSIAAIDPIQSARQIRLDRHLIDMRHVAEISNCSLIPRSDQRFPPRRKQHRNAVSAQR